MDKTEEVYNYMKSFMEKNGYPQSVKQTAEALNIKEHEVKEALDALQQSGRIKITDIPRKTTI